MAADTATPPEPPPQKFSRYRSVRRAQAHIQPSEPQQTDPIPAMPPLPPFEAQPDAPVSRSMSRYHRRPATSHGAAAKAPLRSATLRAPAQPTTAQPPPSSRNRALSSPQAQPVNSPQPRVPNTSRARVEAPSSSSISARQPARTARDEAKQLMQDEADRQRRMKEKIEAEKRAKLKAEQEERERQEKLRRAEEEEAERLRAQKEAEEAELLRRQREEKERGKRLQKAETAKRLQEREEAERKARIEEARPKAQASSPPVSPPRHNGGFSMFRKRQDSSPGSVERSSNHSKPPQTSHGNRDMDTIRPGGGGAVLGIDAPISAVNAGDRRVTILCNKRTFTLPVTPETTAQDLLKSAALCMTETIDVHADVLVEDFYKASVKRPLRLYEHVRDIMNSWDSDDQNALEIVNAAYHGYDRQSLVASEVPNSKPEGMSCYIHHSSRPGKWAKKYVTLRPDGQLVMAKSETSKDHEIVCHLSDFDIYTPTERKRAKVKPPKKNCYAVKSQQKSNIFSDETRFVHFFCTNDRSTANIFYTALHGWRSWHLKHVMGEGQKKSKFSESKPANGFVGNGKTLGGLDLGGSSSHARNASVSSYYQLGSFKPLFDLDQFNKDLERDIQTSNASDSTTSPRMDTKAMHVRKMSTRVKGPPPAAFSRTGLVNEATSAPVERTNSLEQHFGPPETETFASSGLLGRTYSHRQKAMQDREKKAAGPFTEGPSLINNIDSMAQASANDGGLNRRSSVRSTHRRTSSDIQRSISTRVKPLVDLTPQYREPPQHRTKGKGFVIGTSSGPLIDNATSLEEAIKIPPSSDWRARPSHTHGTYGTGGHERTRSLKGRGEGLAAYTMNNHGGAPDDSSKGFTGGGLLARSGFSQGHQPVGHGVMDGSKARGPMLNMRENSQFASGSLLAGVQHRQGPTWPIIDRERRQSVDLA